MDKNTKRNESINFVSYNIKHIKIVEAGIEEISKVLKGNDNGEKRSLLLCLDRYLDPYYGYNLPFYNGLINLLQVVLFETDNQNVKEDILELLENYGGETLDYLAERIETLESDSKLLVQALHVLGSTYNKKYISLFLSYEHHDDSYVKDAVKNILTHLPKA